MYTQKVKDAANLAHYAVHAWMLLGFTKRGGAVSVTGLCEMFPDENRYRARQIQQVMHMLGLLYKADNGRYYHDTEGSMFTEDCYWGISYSGSGDEMDEIVNEVTS